MFIQGFALFVRKCVQLDTEAQDPWEYWFAKQSEFIIVGVGVDSY